jgi:hypothetical protein
MVMVLAPPEPAAGRAAEIRALFAEARRRRRRRRGAGVAVVLAVILAVAIGAGARPWDPGVPLPGQGQPARTVAAPGAADLPRIAWVDASGGLHLGSLAAGAQHVVRQTNALPGTPLVQAAGEVYWTDPAGAFMPSLGHWSQVVRELNLATGRTRVAGPGEGIFPSSSGRQLYLPQIDNASLLQIPAAAPGPARLLTLPPGWYLPAGAGMAVGDGIVVQSRPELSLRHPPLVAIWHSDTGKVSVLGRSVGASLGPGALISAYTPPGSAGGLLAWMPADCRYPAGCPVRITSTAAQASRSLASRTLRSPLPWGFALGGAFSPDGRQLAVFVNRGPGHGGGLVQLAIASTSSGALHLVPGARLRIGEDVAWVRWLPGGRQLIAGGVDRDVITTADGPARPFRFRRSPAGAVGYSAAVIPPGR